MGSISSSGWYYSQAKGQEVCIMNLDCPGVCHYSTFVGIVGFLASIGFLIGEWFFEQMSSIKSRKHYVILDMAFSGVWALFYAIAFIFMANSWRKSDEMFSFAKANIIGGIFFSFLSVFFWLGSVGLAYQRFKLDPIPHFHKGWAMRQWDKMEVNIKDIQRKPGTARRPFKEEANKTYTKKIQSSSRKRLGCSATTKIHHLTI